MKIKHLFLLFVMSLALTPAISHAGAVDRLIKASGPSIYYVREDQKRFAFPNAATYKSWYEDFSTVENVNNQALSNYPLIGNVTYRPGKRLVKITTDPKVYAVAHGGILRWIQTEAVARALYGDSWAQQIDDIPDGFFANYQIGAPIISENDYNRTEELHNAYSIGLNIPPALPTSPTLPTPPVPPPSATTTPSLPSALTLLLQPSTSNPHYGEPFTLRTEASPSNLVLRTKIYLDQTELRTCEYYICSSDILIPLNDPQGSHEARVEVYGNNGTMTSSTLRISAASAGSPYTNLILRHLDIEPNGTREIVAQATNNFLAHNLDIYLDGGLVRSCIDQQECRYTAPETAGLGTVHSVFIVAADRNGSIARSETKTFAVVTNDSPVVEVALDKNSLYTGEQINVTVTANDEDGIQQTSLLLNGTPLKTCTLSSCTATIGPWTEARTLQIVGSATDLLGARSFVTSTTITVRIR